MFPFNNQLFTFRAPFVLPPIDPYYWLQKNPDDEVRDSVILMIIKMCFSNLLVPDARGPLRLHSVIFPPHDACAHHGQIYLHQTPSPLPHDHYSYTDMVHCSPRYSWSCG